MNKFFETSNFRESEILVENIMELYNGFNVEELKLARQDSIGTILCGKDYITYSTIFSTKIVTVIPIENILRIEIVYRMGNVPYMVFAMYNRGNVDYYSFPCGKIELRDGDIEKEIYTMINLEKNYYDVSDRVITTYSLKKGKITTSEFDYAVFRKRERKTIEKFESEFNDWTRLSVEDKISSKEEFTKNFLTLEKTKKVEQSPVQQKPIQTSFKAPSPAPLSVKKQYKENKKKGIVSCPKCGSTSVTATNKKISVGKGVAGAAVGSLINPVGTAIGMGVGAVSSKKMYNVCMNCGHKWKP